MKIRTTTSLLLISIIAALGISIVVFTQNKTSAQSADISTQCKVAQANLSGPVKKQDLKTRVYRVQAYQYIYDRLDTFVQRLENNNQPEADTLREQANILKDQIKLFENDYESYNTARDNTASLKDCSKHPTQFSQKLTDMRAKRQQIDSEVSSIDGLLGTTVKSRIADLYTQLLATGTSGAAL